MQKRISNGVMFYMSPNSPFENLPIYSQHTTLCYLTVFMASTDKLFM